MIETYDMEQLPEMRDARFPETVGTCQHEDCTRKLVASAVWERANEKARRIWKRNGYFQNESRMRCRIHMIRKSPAEHNAERAEEAERKARFIAGKYRGLVAEGFRDPIGEIAHQTGLPVSSIQRLLRRAGIDYAKRNTRSLRRMEVIEEVQFFRSFGRGLHEIADKLGMTDGELTRNLRHWRLEGYVDFDLDWLLEYEMKPEEIAA